MKMLNAALKILVTVVIIGGCFTTAHAETLTGQVAEIAAGDVLTPLDASKRHINSALGH